MQSTHNSLKEFTKEKLEEAGVPLPERRRHSKKRHGKSRHKMWYITTELLPRSPNMTDADIKRKIKAKYGEGIKEDIIKQARFIFKRKVDAGEIIIRGHHANIKIAMNLYRALIPKDREVFKSWICHNCPEPDEYLLKAKEKEDE